MVKYVIKVIGCNMEKVSVLIGLFQFLSRHHVCCVCCFANIRALSTEFHAFWEKAYSELTVIVSDTTSESDPVATDFYIIGERGMFLR